MSTIALSKAIDKISYFSFCKRIYDSGYKFSNELSKEQDFHSVEDDFDTAATFIPGFNILNALFSANIISNNIEDAIDELIMDGSIVRMERIEQEIYNKNPNLRTIFTLDRLVQKRLKKAYSIKVENNGKIYYELGDEYSYQVIYKEGSAQSLTYEEIQKYLGNDDLIMCMDEFREFYKEVTEASDENVKKPKSNEKYKPLLLDPYFAQAHNSARLEKHGSSRKRTKKNIQQ